MPTATSALTSAQPQVVQAYVWRNALEGHYIVVKEGEKARVIKVERLPYGTRPVLAFGEEVNPPTKEIREINLPTAASSTEQEYRASLIQATERKYEHFLGWTLAIAQAQEDRADAATALQGCYDAVMVARTYGFEDRLKEVKAQVMRSAA